MQPSHSSRRAMVRRDEDAAARLQTVAAEEKAPAAKVNAPEEEATQAKAPEEEARVKAAEVKAARVRVEMADAEKLEAADVMTDMNMSSGNGATFTDSSLHDDTSKHSSAREGYWADANQHFAEDSSLKSIRSPPKTLSSGKHFNCRI